MTAYAYIPSHIEPLYNSLNQRVGRVRVLVHERVDDQKALGPALMMGAKVAEQVPMVLRARHSYVRCGTAAGQKNFPKVFSPHMDFVELAKRRHRGQHDLAVLNVYMTQTLLV
ncbi:MAG TPA: hypothetical protein VK210_04600, partial [Terriglobia bacterium]|nr:hypothetical protein [Terriglobia bacterium]